MFHIRDRSIGNGRCFFVAELGSNWVTAEGPDFSRFGRLMRAAAEAGFEAVKIQLFRAEKLDRRPERQAQLRPLEVQEEWLPELRMLADEYNLAFIVTPFYVEAVDVAGDYVDAWKVASGDITFVPLLERLAYADKPVILSTGFSTVEEIQTAISQHLHQWDVEKQEWISPPGICTLHCHGGYPAPTEECNLRAMAGEGFCPPGSGSAVMVMYPIGWSDHTVKPAVILAAVALGADIIEMHFDLDGAGLEAGHSWLPDSAGAVIRQAREVEAALGSATKQPMPSEEEERIWARRDPSDWLRPVKGSSIGNLR